MFHRLWLWFLAVYRLDSQAVCEMSACGYRDYHDYPDSIEGYPDHFVALTCKRAGGLDVSEVAKRHGGGGHKAAAGFQVPAALNFVI